MSHLLSPVAYLLSKQYDGSGDIFAVNLEIYRSGSTEYDLLIDGDFLLKI